MQLLYPNDPFQPKLPDETYAEEFQAATEAGVPAALFSYEEFLADSFKARPPIEAGEEICYRGWMLSPEDYIRLFGFLEKAGARGLTSPTAYEFCHHLPRWYHLLEEFTPATRFFSEADDIPNELRKAGWEGCFLKDYVKSLSTAGGSLVRNLDEIPSVVAKMKKYRGQIEGGLCAREIEDFAPESERRYFVFRGRTYSPDGEVPEVVTVAAQRIESPFFPVDTVRRIDGTLRIVELGDGQVSDRKEWPAARLLEVLGK